MAGNPDSQVVIVGGGPVGSVSAVLLARAGISVTVVEKEQGVVEDYRASTFHPSTMDLLDGTGVTEFLVANGLRAPVMQIRDRSAGKVAEFDFGQLKDETRHPYRVQCEQFKLVDYAYGELRGLPNARLMLGAEVTGIDQDENGVAVHLRAASGDETVGGQWLIGCDGGRSVVRKAMDIPFPGMTYPEHFLVAGTTFDFMAHMPDICSVNYTADPVEWYLLLQIPDMWRVITPVSPDVSADDAVSDDHLQRSLKNLLPRNEDYDIVVRAIYRVHQRVADRYRHGRVFLAGDAAHLNNPLGGMGLNGGLHDAISLTRRLTDVCQGADDGILDGYEPQRRPVAINAINAITARNKRLLEERDPEVRKERLDELAAVAADPARAHAYMLEASMIASLRQSGLLVE